MSPNAPTLGTHPLPDQLADFGLGLLKPDEAADIEQHIAGCPQCGAALRQLPDDALVQAVRASATLPTVVGGIESDLANHPRYAIFLERLGVGGMGTVYKARHLVMDRIVALKVLHPRLVSRPAAIERFRREVRAAARLSHPHIVTAFDADQAGDSHFLVMEFVEGESTDQIVARRGPLPIAEACDLVRQAAAGLQHAHECGMVHRDIKPQNLMLTASGVVKILDFGLASVAHTIESAAENSTSDTVPDVSAAALTGVSTVLGTPDYIAPEQCTEPHSVDIRADIYGLGGTLYFLLAGHAPFPHGTAAEKLAAHRDRMPKPLNSLRADVPVALARHVSRMLAKDPADRFPTPAAVAQALTQLGGPKSHGRRRVILAGLATAIAAPAAWFAFRPAASGAFVEVRRLIGHRGIVTALAFSGDGQTLLSAGGDGTLRFWDVADGGERNSIAAHDGLIRSAALSHDGQLALSSDAAGALRLWDLVSGGTRVELPLPEKEQAWSVALSADGRLAASGHADDRVRLWDTAAGRKIQSFAGQGTLILSIALSPGGQLVAAGSWGGQVCVWDIESGQELWTSRSVFGPVRCLAFSPDGRGLLSGGYDLMTHLWDAQTGRKLLTMKGHEKWVHGVAWLPNGELAVSVAWDGTLRLWNTTDGRELGQVQASEDKLECVAVSGSAQLIATAGWDGVIRYWRLS